MITQLLVKKITFCFTYFTYLLTLVFEDLVAEKQEFCLVPYEIKHNKGSLYGSIEQYLFALDNFLFWFWRN